MSFITACIICKNEEQHIKNCIQALHNFQIPIVITDTGSTDNTVEIAKSLLYDSDQLVQFDWCDDFSKARNFCAEKAQTDWIWAIDADEIVTNIDLSKLKSLLKMTETSKKIGTVSQKDVFQSDGSSASQSITQLGRIYNRNFCHYSGKIHEQIRPLLDKEATYFSAPISIDHYGYFDKDDLKRKCRRNIDLLLKELQSLPENETEEAPYLLYQLGKSHAILGMYQEAIAYFQQGLSYDLNPQQAYVAAMVESYGYALLETKQFSLALSFSEIYDAFSYRSDFVFLMALIYMNNGLFENAIAEFKKATTYKKSEIIGVNSYLSYYNIGIIYECTGDKVNARNYYKKCSNYELAQLRLSQLEDE